ncbi:ECF transporter S component [Apilactobacillus kunkeei]|uniref:ECF transporter S component n=1 Tax=Apilactobacillus kunkeei TaxID=148814 RepID=UPI00112CA943|nr:ECF transporter S component [Apilactobacillus kunkeei]TPR53441.1 ECF transporter S component [Apilactobacillus kunkeei]
MIIRNKTYKMNILSVFIAIIIVQTSIPGLGNIPIGPLSVTIIPITVVLAAIVLGTKDGAIVGGVWGLITFVRAFWWPTSPLAIYVFTNPLVSILPRILVGLVAGLIFTRLYKPNKPYRMYMSITGFVSSIVNTVVLLGLVYIFYRGDAFNIYHINVDQLLPYLLFVALTNGLVEAFLSSVLVPVIGSPLLKIRKSTDD